MSKIIRLPGLIDIHVHFRDPGETQKEDFYSGTRAALAGGITTVLDMPNNLNPVFDVKTLEEKNAVAKGKAVCDYGLYFGTDGKNVSEFRKVNGKVAGLKLYLSQTTGKYVVSDEILIDKIFQSWPKDRPLVVHAEGDRVDLALNYWQKYKNQLHLTHIDSKETLKKIIAAKERRLNLTCDTTPNYLYLSQGNLEELNGLGKIKPALKSEEDRNYLWENLKYIDCFCTDHAPHTLEEKHTSNPPSGMPGLETMLPMLLTSVGEGKLTMDDITRKTNSNPQKIFGIIQDKETYTEVDINEKYVIKNESLMTKCGWSPFDGWEVTGRVKKVVIRGITVFSEGKVLVSHGFGRNIRQ